LRSSSGGGPKPAAARACWSDHRVEVASFAQVWLDSGRLGTRLPPGAALHDMSAGRWRAHCYRNVAEYPAVQRRHERRKFLVVEPGRPDWSWLEFVGLGVYGRAKLDRGRRLAAAGFGPPPLELRNGFLLRRFVPGRPLQRRAAPRAQLPAAGRYLAYLGRAMPAPPSIDAGLLAEMIRTNVREGLGDAWADRLDDDGWLAADERRAVALDGRMLAHEWVATPNGYMKTDALEHHDDHFFPGCEDIAWDVAAGCIELTQTPTEAAQLLREYAVRSGDRQIGSRLPFYRVAYLAFRLGYATLAARTLGTTDDGRRFALLVERYAALLRADILRLGTARMQEARVATR
jgi:hypothetical protein